MFEIRTPRSGFSTSESFTWEMAIHWYGLYDRDEFAELDGEEQARIVALYLIDNQQQAIIAQEHAREAKRREQQARMTEG